MVNAMYLDAPGRLASIIVNLTTNSSQKNMTIRITQSSLAASSGMARQTAAKILGNWRKENIPERNICMVYDCQHPLNAAARQFRKMILEDHLS